MYFLACGRVLPEGLIATAEARLAMALRPPFVVCTRAFGVPSLLTPPRMLLLPLPPVMRRLAPRGDVATPVARYGGGRAVGEEVLPMPAGEPRLTEALLTGPPRPLLSRRAWEDAHYIAHSSHYITNEAIQWTWHAVGLSCKQSERGLFLLESCLSPQGDLPMATSS